jgi:membrane fusion protein (multidrug efflux system)
MTTQEANGTRDSMAEHGTRWQGPALLVGTAVALAALFGVHACSQGQGGAGWAQAPEIVEVITVSSRPWHATSTLLATLAPIASIDVSIEVGGRLDEVGFVSGAVVQKGQVLARLDAAVERAELRAAEAELRALTLRLGRVSALASDQGVTRMELDQATADLEAATARAEGLAARIRQKTVVAPFAGRTGVRDVHPGQLLAPGVILTSLVSTDPGVFADFWVPQTLLGALPVGSSVVIRFESTEATAQIEVIAPELDPVRRSARVRARLDPAPVGWVPGMSAQVETPTSEEALRVVVPAAALVWSPVGVLVYRIVPNPEGGEIVTANPVEILSDQGDEVVLASGLEPGARIAVGGAFKLHEGSAIQAAGVAGAAGE